jgi:hypothetical protein
VPFTSIQSFGPHDAAVKAAMSSLETSHDLTTLSACKLVEWSHCQVLISPKRAFMYLN